MGGKGVVVVVIVVIVCLLQVVSSQTYNPATTGPNPTPTPDPTTTTITTTTTSTSTNTSATSSPTSATSKGPHLSFDGPSSSGFILVYVWTSVIVVVIGIAIVVIRRNRAKRRDSMSGISLISDDDDGSEIYIENVEIGDVIDDVTGDAVYMGAWFGNDVTLKLLDINKTDAIEQEAQLRKSANHQNVIHFCGIFRDTDHKRYFVHEYIADRDLNSLLKLNGSSLSFAQKLFIAQGIASGMAHLQNQSIFQCDIATRNILVQKIGDNFVAKIADFGVGQQQRRSGGSSKSFKSFTFPIRWTAPESYSGSITTRSIVWSFGVTLWEILSNGATPYSDLEVHSIPAFISAGNRLAVPNDTPEKIAKLLKKCWEKEPEERPSFAKIVKILQSEHRKLTTQSTMNKSQITIKIDKNTSIN